MKKIISLVLIVAMLLIGTAFAEEITLFSNVHMGNTYDEVVNLLAENGYKYPKTDSNSTRMSEAYNDNEIAILRVNTITIAGIDDSEVVFAFNGDNEAYQCLYTFGTSPSGKYSSLTKDEADSMYLATQTMLTKKYGIPENEYFEEQSVYVLHSYTDELGVPFTNCAEMANSIETNTFSNQRCGKVSEWLITLSNGDGVLIDNFIGINDGKYQVYILYTYIPVEAFNQEDNTNDWL